jgi:hypothetical protein
MYFGWALQIEISFLVCWKEIMSLIELWQISTLNNKICNFLSFPSHPIDLCFFTKLIISAGFSDPKSLYSLISRLSFKEKLWKFIICFCVFFLPLVRSTYIHPCLFFLACSSFPRFLKTNLIHLHIDQITRQIFFHWNLNPKLTH